MVFVEILGDDQAEHCVSIEFEAFVGVGYGIFGGRSVPHGELEEGFAFEGDRLGDHGRFASAVLSRSSPVVI